MSSDSTLFQFWIHGNVSIPWKLYPIEMETVSIIWILYQIQIKTVSQKWKPFPKDRNRFQKNWLLKSVFFTSSS